ncbi:MAG: hypothetical protein ABIS15_01660 [Gemmatimonadaceae bacterium]
MASSLAVLSKAEEGHVEIEERPEASTDADYAVASPVAAGGARTTYALFFTHGMGQPIPFQTIDQVATSLRALDIELGHHNPNPVGRTIKSGTDWLNRIELRLKSGDDAVDVHLYEGYWAPLTEGRTTARNVIGFLAGAGLNGLRHTKGKFRRWLFGKYPELPIPVRTVFFLLIALAAVASLVVMNSAIAVVAAARALLGAKPPWLSDNLFSDLTTTFNLVVTVMGVFGLSLAAAVLIRQHELTRAFRKVWSAVTVFFFVVTLFVVILAGAGIPFVLYGHVREMTGASQIWHLLAGATVVERFNSVFDVTALRVAIVVAAVVLGRWTWRIIKGLKRDLEDRETALLTAAVALTFLALAAALVVLVVFFVRTFDANATRTSGLAQNIAWPLLVAASVFIRLVLVQFVGDVAIYVMPYKLDAFNDLRREIKLKVYNAAKAVYSQAEYERVIVVGHSLGSVIAYDALNMLILEDESIRQSTPLNEAGMPLDVVRRTPLFLTFGSPLDKTAFIFAVQARGTSEAREALAGSVQPLIQSYELRPKRWINVWSPWDIISGPLDLYDPPRELHDFPAATLTQRVHNVMDQEATTLLVAHTEYWKNPLVVGTIYDEMVPLRASAPRP